jgi:hypothetical protein
MSITQQVESSDTPHANDELLTMKEVAGVVRVSVATLRYWRHLGSGPRSFRVGRAVLARRSPALAGTAEQRSSGSPLRAASASRWKAGWSMASIEKRRRQDGRASWRAHYRTPSGEQRNKTFDRKADAERFFANVESS